MTVLGRAFAEGFSNAGASVIVADINVDGAEKTATQLARNGNNVLGSASALPRFEEFMYCHRSTFMTTKRTDNFDRLSGNIVGTDCIRHNKP